MFQVGFIWTIYFVPVYYNYKLKSIILILAFFLFAYVYKEQRNLFLNISQKTGSSIQEEVGTSACDVGAGS